jgi:hypothetical protein
MGSVQTKPALGESTIDRNFINLAKYLALSSFGSKFNTDGWLGVIHEHDGNLFIVYVFTSQTELHPGGNQSAVASVLPIERDGIYQLQDIRLELLSLWSEAGRQLACRANFSRMHVSFYYDLNRDEWRAVQEEISEAFTQIEACRSISCKWNGEQRTLEISRISSVRHYLNIHDVLSRFTKNAQPFELVPDLAANTPAIVASSGIVIPLGIDPPSVIQEVSKWRRSGCNWQLALTWRAMMARDPLKGD